MIRTTISLLERLLKRLRLMAARYRPRPRSLGIGASGHSGPARRTAEERPEPRAWR